MIEKLGQRFTQLFLKYMPNAFVFAILLTAISALSAFLWTTSQPLDIVIAWYNGFFDLLSFAMQIALIIITGFSIALSPIVKKAIDKFSQYLSSPNQVYLVVVMVGMLLSLVSFGWIVITSVLARELAIRVKGVNYAYLIACVYFSFNSFVMGFSSTIPLLLNSENNFLIEGGVLNQVISTSNTLGSSLNLVMVLLMVIGAPLLMYLIRPKSVENKELAHLKLEQDRNEKFSIEEEASSLKLPFRSVSDLLNNSGYVQWIIVLMGLTYILFHFYSKGFDLNFNIMIFTFLIVGMLLHKTPARYAISMKRSSSNISEILFQYPLYAGIMGIMLYTGLGEKIGQLIASFATKDTYPLYAYLTGGFVNFAIPSAGGEFAVIGPSIINAVKEIGTGLSPNEVMAMIGRASMSVAYGESLSNMLQPFFLLVVMPIMGAGTNLQARDVMGYLVVPFTIFFILQCLLVVFWPL